MTKPVVLALCNRTSNIVRPWIEAGYLALTVDMQFAPPEPGRVHLARDVCELSRTDIEAYGPVALAFAFPPCTDLAVSGAKHFKRKGMGALIKALTIVEACRALVESLDCPYMIENPVSTLSTYWRDPDFTFDPYQFGLYADDPEAQGYTKKTCLWTGGGLIMPQPSPVPPALGSKMFRMPPSADRADKRSETPLGFARAVYEANRHFVREPICS